MCLHDTVDHNDRPDHRRRPRRLPPDMVRLPRWLALVMAVGLVAAFDDALGCSGKPAKSYSEVPPVILPILPDGGACEHPPLTDDHPGPDEVWSLLQEPPTASERREVEVVLDGCPNASRRKIDPWRVLAALRLEDALGVPRMHRFLFPATLCVESGFSTADDLRGDQGAARGPFQLHWAWTAFCKDGKTWGRSSREWAELMSHDPRDDLAFSARCQMAAIKRVMKKAKACGPEKAFQVAEAIVSRAPHPLNCHGRTAHVKLAEVWRALL